MKPNVGYYVQTINDIVKYTEEIGETMHPYYEEIRQAIDRQQLEQLAEERLTEIKNTFTEGTAKYEAMLKKVKALKPTPRVLGIHKKFERAYTDYVAGCQEMLAAIDPARGVDVNLFDRSESKQDQATDELSFAITRMSNILLKK